jgi:predicted ABC-type transport system involved in lysophospholipase L1 biosynthesis ATPase subunit
VSPREVDEARRVLASVGIAEKLFERTDQLSGGEQQRVAIARALRQDPRLVLADEPTASLDRKHAEACLDLLLGFVAEAGSALVLVTHDAAVEARLPRVERLASPVEAAS